MANKKIQEEKKTAEEKIISSVSNFFQKNRLIVIIIVAAIIVGIVAAVILVNASTKAKNNAQLQVAELESRYSDLLSETEPDWSTLATDLKANVKGSSYPSVKSAYLLGLVYYQMADYAAAQSAFEQAYSLNKDVYLASEALCNAAACAEAQGNVNRALELYNQVFDDYPESGCAPKALFNSARINLQLGNTDLAKLTFGQVSSYYADSEYGKLALNISSVL